MSRFTLHREASRDLDEIITYLRTIPKTPALKIGSALQAMLKQIAEFPHMGVGYTDFTRRHGFAIRSRICGNYKIFYRTDLPLPEVIAILHMKRDIDSFLRNRL